MTPGVSALRQQPLDCRTSARVLVRQSDGNPRPSLERRERAPDLDALLPHGRRKLVRPTSALTLGLDWQRILYGGVAAVGDSIDSLFAGVPLGASNGPGFGWRDISVFKLGASYAISESATLRAGIAKSQQPVPASQTFFNILAPGVIETHLTAGGSWKLAHRNEISVAWLHAFKKTVDGSGSIPPAFGGGEANISLAEDSLAISFSHGLQ